jgi:hypothetical protein
MDKERFCGTCYSHRNPVGGRFKSGNRWVCRDCTTKIAARKPPVIADFAPKPIKFEEWRFR